MNENNNSEESKQNVTPPTPEEVKAYKDKMTKFYEEELPFLRLKEEYERLNSHVAQHRLNEFVSKTTLARHIAATNSAKDDEKK